MNGMMKWMAVGLFFALAPFARAEDDENYTALAKTFSGKVGTEDAVLELISSKESGTYIGRFALLKDGRDVPLVGPEEKAEGPTLVFGEEAPCTAKTCQSIVPERDDEFGDLAPGAGPVAATWTLTVSEDGKSITGTRKDGKSGTSSPLTFTYAGERKILYDCCTGADIAFNEWDNGAKFAEEEPYDAIRSSTPLTKGDAVETLDGATYRLDRDERIMADVPVVLTLPGKGSPDAVNRWLLDRRIATFAADYQCASRLYHRFRWNKAHADLLKQYEAQSGASVEFVSDKLVAIEETLVNQCEPERGTETNYLMADTATGETVFVGALMKDFQTIDNLGSPADLSEGGMYAPKANVIQAINALRETPSAGNPEKCDPQKQMMLTAATLRGRNLVFEIPPYNGDGVDCLSDEVTVPLEEAGPFLNDKGKAYLADLIK